MSTNILEPGEYEVHLIDLPPVARAEIDGIIRNQIPVLHPGPAEKMLLQYRLYKAKANWKALVFLIPHNRLQEGSWALAFDAIQKLPAKADESNVYIVGRNYIEFYRFVSSAPIEVNFASIASFDTKSRPGRSVVIDLYNSGWLPEGACDEVIPGESIRKKPIQSVTDQRHRRVWRFGSIRAAAALIVFLVSFVAFFEVRVARAAQSVESIRSMHASTNQADDVVAVSDDELLEIEGRIRHIVTQKNYRPYTFLETLYTNVGATGLIESLEYDRGAFNIRVLTEDPLATLRSVSQYAKFSDVASTSIAPGSGFATGVLISGRYLYDSP